MQLIRYQPAPPLDRYVACFWWSYRNDPQNHCEHMLPSGSAQLIFALHDAPIQCWPNGAEEPISWSGSIVHGPQSQFYIAGPKTRGGVIGVSFRLGGAGAVLGASMMELASQHIALDAVWGRRGVDLHHRLCSVTDPRNMFLILEQSLSARIHRLLLIHPAIAHALSSPLFEGISPARVAHVQRASGYSPRYFIALFRSAVGINPKHYYRIQRFNAAAQLMAANVQSLGNIAATTGYSDQSHLTRDFHEFSGVAPTQYRPSGSDRPLHHQVDACGPAPGKKTPRRLIFAGSR